NLNHIGEAILSEDEAERRLHMYLDSLADPCVEYVSVKISSICSQINLIAKDETLKILKDRLRRLYRAAAKERFTRPDGSVVTKFVNLDMEEYRDLHLTMELFQSVLSEPEFFRFSAGLVLQAYLPDSYLIQQELTVWAMKRVAQGGAPIKIRLVKGANLAMERVESSLHSWRQAPYDQKIDVDANYKRMLDYGTQPDHARAARIAVGSHNLFDIAYAMLIREERSVAPHVSFEMLEGMADHIRRTVFDITGDILLYAPSAKRKEFVNAVSYLIRRLDENTADDNFLRHSFDLEPGSPVWEEQVRLFSEACNRVASVSHSPRRSLNRFDPPKTLEKDAPFANDASTDWALEINQQWARRILGEWHDKRIEPIACM
ncbi:MAG: proline dehydrogenase family protein, partial [Chlamydiia bacterium]|nr:proline dehydrogenase family protein [Chlamydiia bacterium]